MTGNSLEKRAGGIEPIGMHPDWNFWPERARFPTINAERWMLCTDGCYFVNLDHPGMLMPAERNCSVCGCPLHPARPVLDGRDRCVAHREADADDDPDGDGAAWDEDDEEDDEDEDDMDDGDEDDTDHEEDSEDGDNDRDEGGEHGQ